MISDLSPALIPVVQIFVGEFDDHLGFFREKIERIEEDEVKTAVGHRFHTIRGSSGFLQLTEIKDLAESGEKLCKSTDNPEELKAELEPIVSRLSSLFDQLAQELEQLQN